MARMKTIINIWVGLLFMLSLLIESDVIAQQYTVDTDKSKISWTGWKELFGRTMSQTGSLKFASGSFTARDGVFTSGSLTIDMNSISHFNDGKVYTDNDVVTHLKSESCFFTRKYPHGLFVIKHIKNQGSSVNAKIMVTGDLIIKGISKTLTFPASVVRPHDQVIITSSFQFNRKHFNLNLEPFLISIGGDRIVRDTVDMTVEIFGELKD
jgi:polyisoprenoid-binding protein YceI